MEEGKGLEGARAERSLPQPRKESASEDADLGKMFRGRE